MRFNQSAILEALKDDPEALKKYKEYLMLHNLELSHLYRDRDAIIRNAQKSNSKYPRFK